MRFDDVHWKNFGREEGLFAGGILEKWFGKRIFSLRFFTSATTLLVICVIIGFIKYTTHHEDQRYVKIGTGVLVALPPPYDLNEHYPLIIPDAHKFI